MKKTLLTLCAMAMAAIASAQFTYSVDPAAETVLPKAWGNYANMAFTFTFDEAVTVNNADAVKLYEMGATASTEVAPDDDWRANSSNGGKTVMIWGADYDGFTCTFQANDCEYQLVIPAGTFTTASGAANEELRITYYGLNAPEVPALPLSYVTVEPEEESVLGAETN